MAKPISRRLHGAADYSYAAAIVAAPRLFGFQDDSTAVRTCQVMGAGVLLATLLTRAEWGAVRVIPFRTHLAADFGAGLLAMGAPWLFGFSGNARARTAFLAFGATSVLASRLTQPEEMP
ncbi:SPW repeat domain-containing protein [Deinococcus koreensis]|uniref:SPW repeat-containing integral membrane domain-containing protein n=1 Tax=Deinococcus koreensis TaxID=2054903 RepID=A0A2K3USF7_9DEIO|nr:hypothetical protein [Deinococcus koreensis]PNY79479.1 hypothetical protein CVO96_18785 [Deinococcus koreensis]